MSRIIVKNLPNDVDANKLREQFSELGHVTDLQLKYTPQGKFRKFCFVGYESAEQANSAVSHFNKAYYGTSLLQVELCSELGDAKKSKAWSKYSTENNAFSKKEINNSSEENETRVGKKRKMVVEDAVVEQIKKHKNDTEFIEFMELHGTADKVLKLQESDDEGSDKSENEKKSVTNNCAHSAISDLEYLKTKMKGSNTEAATKIIKYEKPSESSKQYFTVKISNLPYKATKKDIRRLLNPVTPASIRLPPKIKGIAFVGTSLRRFKCSIKISSVIFNGRQLTILDYQQKQGSQEITQNRYNLRSNKLPQEEALKNEENIGESGRIFIRNLAYSLTEEEIQNLFTKFGPLAEVILPIDRISRQLKGYGIVTFVMPEHALNAYTALDGTILHGRMLHLLPARAKEGLEESLVEEETNFKNAKFKKLKAKAGSSHNWNSLFLDLNALADVISKKYNVTKEDVLTGKDAAVRLALAETQLVTETKKFLEENGVKLDAFNQEVKKRSKTVMLVKNLPANTTIPEIRELFAKYGELGRVLLPPNGITGLVEFLEPSEARVAFKRLAYSKFKYLPLYLEWAPDDSLAKNEQKESKAAEMSDGNVERQEEKEMEDSEESVPETNATLFVKNLNFQCTEDDLIEHFKSCGKIASAIIARKKDTKVPGSLLSMGYGFVHFYFASSAKEALKRLQGTELQGHKLELKISHRTLPVEVMSKRKKTNVAKQTGTKIMVRNIPFQATAKEITELFKIFGELKFVRLPKKLVGTGKHRGFAFVEFVTQNDARRAMKTLCQSTHLFGRRLVLEWAQPDQDVNTIMKATAKHFHGIYSLWPTSIFKLK
uniref:RRM domain-containing protein n=1 Tax=Rhodnius prolixus TaxID=13249 RepID=T1HN71_RHOPR